jgi:PAS domain S-box-containing protein
MPVTETIRILYIEDDESSAAITLEYLKRDPLTKFIVKRTCTLNKGLSYLEKHCNSGDCGIDIILLDLILPNSHGVATYKSVVEKSKFIPIVVMSAYEDLALQCMKLGAQEYLVKPNFTQSALTRVLRYSYERSKVTQEKLDIERKYRKILYHIPIGFHDYELIDGELYLVGYNPSADEILKIDHSELLNKSIEDAFPGLVGTGIKEEYTNILKTGMPFSEIRNYSDYHIPPGHFKVHAFQTGKNTLSVSFEDITAQIESQHKYKNLVEATNAGIYEIDFRNGKLLYVNHVIANQMGYTKEEMLNMNVTDLLTEDSLKKWNERLMALARGEHIDKTAEYTAIKKDGSLVYILITAEYIEDEDGNVKGANVVTIDITESVLAKEEAKRKEEKIFNELENRIHQWRDELTLDVTQNKQRRDIIGDQFQNLNKQSEVIV